MTECSSQLIRGNFYNEAQYNLMRSIPWADGSGGDSLSLALTMSSLMDGMVPGPFLQPRDQLICVDELN